MKKTLVALMLLSLTLTGCVFDPGEGGYRDRGYDNRGWGGHNRGDSHDDRGQHGNWNR